MRLALVALLVACGSDHPSAVPAKPPNNELIIGTFERHRPDAKTAMRFRADGSFVAAKTAADLDSKPAHTGHWTLEGDKLTFNNETGACTPDHATGTYQVVISKIGIRFTKVEDDCPNRASIDQETWYRIK